MIFLAQANVPAETTATWAWGLAGFACAVGGIFWAWNQIRQALGKSQPQTIAPQPLVVEITKKLHEQFADKKVFQDHVEHNTGRHAQLFKDIDRVERATRAELDRRFAELSADRQRTMEKLSEQLAFIRESIVEVKTELKLRK